MWREGKWRWSWWENGSARPVGPSLVLSHPTPSGSFRLARSAGTGPSGNGPWGPPACHHRLRGRGGESGGKPVVDADAAVGHAGLDLSGRFVRSLPEADSWPGSPKKRNSVSGAWSKRSSFACTVASNSMSAERGRLGRFRLIIRPARGYRDSHPEGSPEAYSPAEAGVGGPSVKSSPSARGAASSSPLSTSRGCKISSRVARTASNLPLSASSTVPPTCSPSTRVCSTPRGLEPQPELACFVGCA
jgi:hypothetical protein